MMRRATWLVGAMLGAGVACQSEVTLHLLSRAAETDAGPEVPPPPCQKLGPEVCNGGDDDCNGLVDEGCDYTVAWTREPDGVVLGHATGGVMFLAPCPDGAVLTGVLAGMGKWLNQVVAVCRQIALQVDTLQSPVQLLATLGPRFDTPFAPAQSTDPANQVHAMLCPDGLIVSGLDGTTTTDEPHYILGLQLTCAPPVVTTALGGPVFDTERAQAKTTDTVVCTICDATQVFNFTTAIDLGRVATGLIGGDGLWVDRVGMSASVGSISRR